MNIDLSRFVKEKEVILPIVNGWGKKDGRKFQFRNLSDGWYKIFVDDKVKLLGPATQLEIYKEARKNKTFTVYAYGEEGIPTNFDTFTRMGLGQSVHVYFLNLPIYSIGKITQFEDKRFYFVEEIQRTRTLELLKDVHNRANAKLPIGITPELAYYNLLIQLTSQAFREVDRLNKLVLSAEERAKRVKEFENTIEGRLKKLITDAGGTFIDYKKSRGKNILVTWSIGGQTIKSQIEADTFHIISAGFCLSGDDKRHTMSSIVRLAEDFQEDDPLYITRE